MKKPSKPLREKQFIATVGGLMCCTPPEFESIAYKGLHHNNKKRNKLGASKPTNVGDPNQKR
jgi:hypothetical protein